MYSMVFERILYRHCFKKEKWLYECSYIQKRSNCLLFIVSKVYQISKKKTIKHYSTLSGRITTILYWYWKEICSTYQFTSFQFGPSKPQVQSQNLTQEHQKAWSLDVPVVLSGWMDHQWMEDIQLMLGVCGDSQAPLDHYHYLTLWRKNVKTFMNFFLQN